MVTIFKKTGRFLIQSTLTLLSVAILFLAILQVVFIFGALALNTGKARDFVQTRVSEMLSQSGYDLTFDGFLYDPVRGFSLYGLEVHDKSGAFASASRLSVVIDYTALAMRKLDIWMDGDDVLLSRLPESTAPADDGITDEKPLKPFALPDIYFREILLTNFSLRRLDIGADVAGTRMSFAPRFQARVRLSDAADIKAAFKPNMDSGFGRTPAPEYIALDARFDSQNLLLTLNDFSISSAAYKATAKGVAGLQAGQNVSLNLRADAPNLRPLTGGQLAQGALNANLTGTYDSPALHAQAQIIPDTLKQKGLETINLDAAIENMRGALAGTVSIDTSYQERPVEIAARFAPAQQENEIFLESLKGTAPSASLEGTGIWNKTSSIFTGDITVDANDLSAYRDLTGVHLAGAIKANLKLSNRTEKQAAAIRANAQDLRYEDLRLNRADLSAGFDDINIPWPQTASLTLSRAQISKDISVPELKAAIKEADAQIYRLSIDGRARLPAALEFKGGATLSNLTSALPDINDIRLSLSRRGSALTITGDAGKGMADITAHLADFQVADLPVSLPETVGRVSLTGDITLKGPFNAPETQADIIIAGLGTGHYSAPKLNLSARQAAGHLNADLTGKGNGIRALNAGIGFPLQFSLHPFAFDIASHTDLKGSMTADIDLAPFAALALPPTQALRGALNANAEIGGTIGAPQISGKAAISGASFSDTQNGINLADIQARATFTKESLTLQSLSATDGEEGRLSASGAVSFGTGNAAETNLLLQARNFHIPNSNLANGYLDADLTLRDTASGYAANGTIDVNRMNITVPETFQSKIPQLNITRRRESNAADEAAKTISLGVMLNAPNQVFVRGWGLDAEFGGTVEISGDASTPLLNGNLSSIRGRYEEFGKRFSLARANLRFQGEVPPSPYLDVEATAPAGDITASVLLTGPVTSPGIAFASSPPVPQDEVVSRILFEKGTTNISPFQAIQLAQTIRRFSGEGGGGFDPLGMLRSATGLDDLSVETDDEGTATVGAGKYLTDKVYLGVEGGSGVDAGAATLQIELTPQINIESEIGRDAQGGGGIFWKKDY